MLFVFFHVIALTLYTLLSIYFIRKLIKQQVWHASYLIAFTAIAVISHGIGLYLGMITQTGIDLSIHNMLSLVVFSVNSLVLISSLRKPLHSLLILLLPISTLTLSMAILLDVNDSLSEAANTTYAHLPTGIGLHILLSVIAYSLLLAAVLQALLVNWQNDRLKTKHISGVIRHLPALQTMEKLLFEFVWVGVILLTVGLTVGAFYIDNMFAQNLAHKTILSAIAWLIFVILLWGRVLRGWRGTYAIRWVLGGFCALMLAYFGSKLVLEVILV
jgi:ABC-type uncharacterized transport system permease subunit